MKTHYDCIIVGSGLIGTTAAIALAKNLNWKIALFEEKVKAKVEINTSDNLDTRTIALNYASVEYFKQLDLWHDLEPVACPIKQVQISEQGNFGVCKLTAAEVHYPFLGQVIEIKHLQKVLLSEVARYENIDDYNQVKVLQLTKLNQAWQLELEYAEQKKNVTCDYVILADGSNSKLRQQLPITCETFDYNQNAIVAVTNCNQAHQFTAYERFTQEKILAVLPLTQDRIGTVLTCPQAQLNDLLQLDDAKYLILLQKLLGDRLGKLTAIGPRQHYPLQLMLANQFVYDNIILLGNTAHTFNPVAAQGLNLGLAGLKDCVHSLKIGEALTEFANRQKQRCLRLKKFTHVTSQVFSSDAFFTELARHAALLALEHNSNQKQKLTRQMMGLG